MNKISRVCPKCNTTIESPTLEGWREAARAHFRKHGEEPTYKNPAWRRWDSNVTYQAKYSKASRKPMTPEQLEQKRELQREARARQRAAQVRPLKLDRCPFCKGEFFRRVGGKMQPMELDTCSACNVRFYYAQ